MIVSVTSKGSVWSETLLPEDQCHRLLGKAVRCLECQVKLSRLYYVAQYTTKDDTARGCELHKEKKCQNSGQKRQKKYTELNDDS